MNGTDDEQITAGDLPLNVNH